MFDRESDSILKRLVDQWTEVRAGLPRIRNSAQIRPAETHVFRPVAAPDVDAGRQAAFFELQPLVLNLPEQPRYVRNDLYVVVRGLLSFRRAEFRQHNALVTNGFSSEVAYFRRSGGKLEHRFGAHYDFTPDETGHPAFHCQMKSFAKFSEHVAEHFRLTDEVNDFVEGVLVRVRIPTAQMDVFSLILQMCADHLLYTGSSDAKRAFNALLAKSNFCQGAAFQVPRLGTDDARVCYRARHWYPS